jgi:hypothetical protein
MSPSKTTVFYKVVVDEDIYSNILKPIMHGFDKAITAILV